MSRRARFLTMKHVLAALLGSMVLAAPAAAQDVATLDRSSPIAAYGGRLLWSSFDPATQTYGLVTRVGGVTSPVAVARRTVPFDADLGPSADGSIVAVYSRCATEITSSGSFGPSLYGKGRGCDLYLFDFATGHDARLASASAPDASEFWPTIWKGTLAFARTYDAKRDFPYIYTRPLQGSARSTRQPGGPRSGCAKCDDKLSRPVALDLYGKRLAFAWQYIGTGEGFDTDIRMDTVGGGHVRVAHQPGGGLTQVEPSWPAFESGRLYWSIGCFGDESGCPGRYGLRRYRISTGDIERAPGSPSVLSHDRDQATTWILDDGQPGTSCLGDPEVPGGTCTLRGSQPLFG
jgi:hypothetical protein